MTPQQNKELIKARIHASYNPISQGDEIQKGGEGSKGGKVIGHTKSGKPIYEHSSIPSKGSSQYHAKKAAKKNLDNFNETYKDFTPEDHQDAAKLFNEKGDHIQGSNHATHGRHKDGLKTGIWM